MSAPPSPPRPALTDAPEPGVWSLLARAGATTAVLDGLFSSILSAVFYGSTVTRLFQGVASVLLGSAAFEGGARTALVGVLMHVAVAFTWATVFLFVVMRSSFVRRVLASRFGVVKVAGVYGPLVWMVMSLVVIPALTHRPPVIAGRWWIQWFGHIPFVGIPIAASSRRR
jgi:hypothetical protein